MGSEHVWLQTVARSVGNHRFDHVAAYSESEEIKTFGGEKDDNEGFPANVRNVALCTGADGHDPKRDSANRQVMCSGALMEARRNTLSLKKKIWSEFLNSQSCVATNSKLSVLLNFCESSDSSPVQHQNRSSSAEDLIRPLEVRRSPSDPTAFPEIPVGNQSNEAEDHETPTSCWKRIRGEAVVHERHGGLGVILLQIGKIAQQARACKHPFEGSEQT